jgi:cobalt-zinc-cadmium efflux system membrane fusion protein
MTEVKTGNSENGFIEIMNPKYLQNSKIVTKEAYTILMKLKNKTDE